MGEVRFTDNAHPGAVIRLNQVDRGPEFIARTSFDQRNLITALSNILLETYLVDEHFELLLAVVDALSGKHAGMKLTAEKLEEGNLPRAIYEWRSRKRAERIADQVDMDVARGTKQESAIAQAMQDFGVSRREVFRCLKYTRAERLADEKTCADSGLDFEPLCPGFDVAQDGKLVTASRPT